MPWGAYDQRAIEARLRDLEAWTVGLATSEALERTWAFVERCFNQWTHPRPLADWAFVAGTRLGSGWYGGGAEWAEAMPLLALLDERLLLEFVIGIPPCVVDRYSGGDGILVSVPVFPEMFSELGRMTATRKARAILHESLVWLREGCGVGLVGLGATLPSLTDYGRATSVPGLATTTGHAGTAWLVLASVREELDRRASPRRVSVVGLGSIGSAVAHLLLESDPHMSVSLFDAVPSTLYAVNRRLVERFGRERVSAAAGFAQILETTSTVVSTATTPLHFGDEPRPDIVVIDDSQPPSVSPDERARMGGRVRWVVATSNEGEVHRVGGWRFGWSLAQSGSLFGCEAETLAIHRHGRSNDPIGGPVNMDDVQRVGALMEQASIQLAPAEAFGATLEP